LNELIFLIEEDIESGYTAKALGEDIFTEADSIEVLKENIKDAVRCHFDSVDLPKLIRLHFVKDEVLSL
jgi:hypothetical protein